jgi:di/tricarboxylate transporter
LLLEALDVARLLDEDAPEFALVTPASKDGAGTKTGVSTGGARNPVHACVGGGAILMIGLATASGLCALPLSCLLAVFLLLFSGVVSAEKATAAVSGKTLTVIACGFGIASALVSSGAATAIAGVLQGATSGGGGGGTLTLVVLFLVSALAANVISPPACASLMFPIAFQLPYADTPGATEDVTDNTLGVLMIACSCSFLTPFSYQTNLMVTEVAGYSAKEFLRFGAPLFAIAMVVTVVLVQYAGMWGDGDPFGS